MAKLSKDILDHFNESDKKVIDMLSSIDESLGTLVDLAIEKKDDTEVRELAKWLIHHMNTFYHTVSQKVVYDIAVEAAGKDKVPNVIHAQIANDMQNFQSFGLLCMQTANRLIKLMKDKGYLKEKLPETGNEYVADDNGDNTIIH